MQRHVSRIEGSHEGGAVTRFTSGSQAAVYAIAGQIGWFACVLGAAHDKAWIGALTVASLASIHLCVVRDRRRAMLMLCLVTLCGWLWECGVMRTGWVKYPSGATTGYAPYWMAAPWMLFALQINPVFHWLRGRWQLAALLGGVAGPLSFRAGAALGAVQLVDPFAALLLIAAGWIVWLPALVWFGKRLDDA